MQASESILTLIVQVALILALSRFMGFVFARLHQPQVVGEMAAGIMLGPSLLGWLAPTVHGWLFPAESVAVLHILSQLGVVFFLFLIGLEFDPNLIRNRGRSALTISASSIIVPFAMGIVLTHYLYPRIFLDVENNSFTATALFMGAAISVTAFPVLARIIAERNLHKTPVGAISITAAAVNDVIAWCMLAVVVAVAQYDESQSRLSPMFTIAAVLVYLGVMFLFIKPSLRRLQRLYETRGTLSQNSIAIIFLLVLTSAYATERIGIHALFGAFVMGLIMPKRSRFVHDTTEKLQDFTVVFMLPIFFAYAGLSTDMRQILRADLVGYTLLIIAVACIGKVGGTMLASRVCGIAWRESAALGVLMNTRGLMELIILTIGLQLQIIGETAYAMMVIMALVTTALTTPLLYWVYPAARFGGDEAEAKSKRERGEYSVLVPVSLPQSGPAMARLASMLMTTGKVLAIHLRRPEEQEAYRSGLDNPGEDASDEVLAPLMKEATLHRLPVEPISFVTRDIASDISAVAKARGVDLVLMGFHKPIIGKTILGGVVHGVVGNCQADLAILVDRGFEDAKRIIVPFAGSPHDLLAMELAARIARSINAQVTVLHVVEPTDPRTPSGARQVLDRVSEQAGPSVQVRLRVVPGTDPLEVVLREAPDYDLIVVGMSETWGLESRFIGMRPERIAAEFPGSLLIVNKCAATTKSASSDLTSPMPTPTVGA